MKFETSRMCKCEQLTCELLDSASWAPHLSPTLPLRHGLHVHLCLVYQAGAWSTWAPAIWVPGLWVCACHFVQV